MAADGGHGPKPYVQHKATTLFLRVPSAEWALVSGGYKTEFRGARGASSAFFNVEPPCPVIAYAIHQGQHLGKLMILEECYQEPLGAISPESLKREGYPDIASFRKAWMAREKRRFQATRLVWVYRVSPWDPTRMSELGEHLIERLYGEWLEGGIYA